MTIIFFGSFQSYSVQILQALIKHFTVSAVVTTPARPAGRHMALTPTDVERFARAHKLPVYPLKSLASIPKDIDRPDFIVVAGYGNIIPPSWLNYPKVMAVNVHQSLLPDYRGAFPAEWAILRGEKTTGITILRMSPELDTGDILVQKSIPIEPDDTRMTLYEKLYDLGADMLVEYLPKIAKGEVTPKPQPSGNFFYARHITREDGFIPWNQFEEALTNNPEALDRKLRALSGWPGVWTTTPAYKRLKLIALKPHMMVQLEGKKPVLFKQFLSSYPPKASRRAVS
ncbi:methionyl-tRNA formyltransferase [Candidatus Gottesmanbacteria bacterium]|nr:methionyl-tRNA formyltransferase [Candidatus Gottesmanbacteria bacterium]